LRLLNSTVALLLLALLVPACGKKGPPLPPSPRGPLPSTEVSARQLGSDILVTFKVPQPRGPKPARQPVRAELIRVAYAPGFEAQPDPSVFRRRGERVAILEGDPLPSGEFLPQFVDDLKAVMAQTS
jgi:predicted small lipoprotein YifL